MSSQKARLGFENETREFLEKQKKIMFPDEVLQICPRGKPILFFCLPPEGQGMGRFFFFFFLGLLLKVVKVALLLGDFKDNFQEIGASKFLENSNF